MQLAVVVRPPHMAVVVRPRHMAVVVRPRPASAAAAVAVVVRPRPNPVVRPGAAKHASARFCTTWETCGPTT